MMAPTYVWQPEPPRLEKGSRRPTWWASFLSRLGEGWAGRLMAPA